MTTVSWRQTTTTPRHVNVTSHVTGPWRHIYVIASHWLAVFNGGSRREWVGEPLAGTFKGKTLQKTGIWDAAPEATELNVSDSHRCVQFARSSDDRRAITRSIILLNPPMGTLYVETPHGSLKCGVYFQVSTCSATWGYRREIASVDVTCTQPYFSVKTENSHVTTITSNLQRVDLPFTTEA